MRGATTHKALGRLFCQFRPGCRVILWQWPPLGVSLKTQFFLPITNGRMARSAVLLSIDKHPCST